MISFRRWLVALAVVAVVSVGVVAIAPTSRPAPPPPTIRRTPDARPVSTIPRPIPPSNQYRTRDGHCFGMDPAQAAARGIQPDPACTAVAG